ncbi:hypothetical protein HNQ85_000225 [Anoxybacillus calidus]|uniref:Uncharacterized protein n=1 Tax=[Anoxybacillus] calidus TaxID=575178 RepID=A0A7V9YXD1_9BACL|nr:hypothetical protein [Anoxybacillus calidus]MBA2869967.1 hypothetical protein [Anoxybacillus calidus]
MKTLEKETIVELKLRLLRVVNSLMYDDCYTKEHAVNALKDVIRRLDKSEPDI